MTLGVASVNCLGSRINTGGCTDACSAYRRPSFCIMLAGSCKLAVDGNEVVTLNAGDFVLLPTTPAFTISSFSPAPPIHLDPNTIGGEGEVRYGDQNGAADMRSLGGAFLFEASDPALLVSLLPLVVHVPGSTRLAQLVSMVGEEYVNQRPGQELMLSHLVGMMLIEAMRSTSSGTAPPGLLKGLGDERLASALKQMHAHVAHPWTVAELANIAALSRSAFFDRFSRTVGVAPMEYLLSWRMALAKDLLGREGLAIAEVAERVGYASTSTFSTAFSRHFGQPPRQFIRSASPRQPEAS
ncbi:AraC family transcriptional regulator [Paucibacter sp. R3-3]|uniref:AraC family transcriptional regulator n=1 Tax=Roseateles agri TaxID=3098619 RepID=A0ABU5DN99_9BURK|nr:AraC family transcriptional regulator [Paucibacter sp. R3-3]MDY0747785.1 AraC family transcriptional regulator [Paucibacter sp. R3-3]